MIKFFALLSLFVGFSAQATIPSITLEPEVEKHIQHMREKGYLLSNVKDEYASVFRRPRCECDSYTFTFSKFVVRNRVGVINQKNYSVTTDGYGAAKKINVNLIR